LNVLYILDIYNLESVIKHDFGFTTPIKIS